MWHTVFRVGILWIYNGLHYWLKYFVKTKGIIEESKEGSEEDPE